MFNVKTHFEQVPLEVVKKILADEARPENPVGKDFFEASAEIESHDGRNAMSDRQQEYPQWQVPLQDLLLEFDQEKAGEKMQKVEALIFERLQRLHEEGDFHSERLALNDALMTLRILKRNKLGFPDWK